MNVATFHRQRRMFAILENALHLAEENTPESHKEWFQRMGWIKSQNDSRFQTIVRGYADSTMLHFYCGKDFEIDEESERIFFAHIASLCSLLNLPASLPICGGAIPQTTPGRWPVRNTYGVVGNFLRKTPAL